MLVTKLSVISQKLHGVSLSYLQKSTLSTYKIRPPNFNAKTRGLSNLGLLPLFRVPNTNNYHCLTSLLSQCPLIVTVASSPLPIKMNLQIVLEIDSFFNLQIVLQIDFCKTIFGINEQVNFFITIISYFCPTSRSIISRITHTCLWVIP